MDDGPSRDKINRETARISWQELAPFFAQGLAVGVAEGMDLVEVAYQFAVDNGEQVKTWMESDQVGPVKDEQASVWLEADADVWAVVVKPFVLVQYVKEI